MGLPKQFIHKGTFVALAIVLALTPLLLPLQQLSAPASAQSATNTKLAVVGATGASLYAEPGGAVVAPLTTGDVLSADGRTADSQWLQVTTEGGDKGWVKAAEVVAFGVSGLAVVGGAAPAAGSTPAAAATVARTQRPPRRLCPRLHPRLPRPSRQPQRRPPPTPTPLPSPTPTQPPPTATTAPAASQPAAAPAPLARGECDRRGRSCRGRFVRRARWQGHCHPPPGRCTHPHRTRCNRRLALGHHG